MSDVASSSMGGPPTHPGQDDASLGELLSRLTTDFGELVSTQVELAKVEVKDEARRAGKGAGMLTAAGLAGYLALALLSWAAAWGLAEIIPTGWAFVIVGVVWAIVAAVLAANGRKQFKNMQPLPETNRSLQEDRQWARQLKT
jgi:uncharacterized membrane protein YqjE